MTEKLVIQAHDRKELGKRFARFCRTQDQVLAVMYNAKDSNVPILVPGKIMRNILSLSDCFNRAWDLELNDKKHLVLVHEVSRHVVNNDILHIDFLQISKEDYVSIKVPINIINQDKCPGLKIGGLLNVVMRDVDLKCPADQIPHDIECDLSQYNIGDSVHVKDLNLPPNAKLVHDDDSAVLSITAPQAEETTDTEDKDITPDSDPA